ncbi:hypothetical protein ABPG74_013656 [Tetrahymena malaccensis]
MDSSNEKTRSSSCNEQETNSDNYQSSNQSCTSLEEQQFSIPFSCSQETIQVDQEFSGILKQNENTSSLQTEAQCYQAPTCTSNLVSKIDIIEPNPQYDTNYALERGEVLDGPSALDIPSDQQSIQEEKEYNKQTDSLEILQDTLIKEETYSIPQWNYEPQDFKADIDFEKYDKENLEHLKKVYKPPQIEDVVEKVEQEENGLKIQTASLFNIPKCNILKLDMNFLQSWQSKEIVPNFTMYSEPKANNGENVNSDEEETNPYIDKKWCRDVQVVFEERDQNGELIDKYRVVKEKRTVKLQGDISAKWYICLEQMKPNETKWFKMEQKLLWQIGQKNLAQYECIYLKIQVIGVKALALSEMKDKLEQNNLQAQHQNIIYEDYSKIAQKSEEFNNEGKILFSQMNYEKAAKWFNKAFSIWRGMSKKLRKTLTSKQEQSYIDKSNQFGANYASCLFNLKKYQDCVDFYQKNKLSSNKNVYKLVKSLYELHSYEKAIQVIDKHFPKIDEIAVDQFMNGNQESLLPAEFQKLKNQCQVKLKALENQSIKTFYRKLFQ